MQLSQEKVKQFQKKILTWYEEHKRPLPWRDVPYGTSLQDRAYRVFISEVMSQQTQIARVISKYELWMKAFPTVEDLSQAKVADVLQHWSGLGYNRRALNLKKAAEIIVKNFNGKFPTTEKELMQLPGIGKYTARAILCFAFDEQVAVVDTNIRKVIMTQILNLPVISSKARNQNEITHHFVLRDDKKIDEKELETIAQMLLPVGRAYDWNQALMDYAGAVLKNEKISILKQSKFIGSHRYYRGQILKKLLEKQAIYVSELGFLIKKDHTISDDLWLQSLLQELVSEGFIRIEQGMVRLAS